MKRKRIVATFASVFLFSFLLSPLSVSATSVGDVIAHAYAVGMPEELIQEYIAMGSGREWTSAQCDQAIAILDSWYGQRDKAISTGGNTSEPIPDPIEPEEFEQLPVEEKKDYITKIPSDEKQEYLDVMTNEEKNTLLKELDTDQQVEVIAGMLGFGNALGYSFSIEDVSDGSVMISARDENDKLVGLTVLGDSVEKTGIPYTVPVVSALSLMILSGIGIVFVLKKSRL